MTCLHDTIAAMLDTLQRMSDVDMGCCKLTQKCSTLPAKRKRADSSRTNFLKVVDRAT